MKYIIMLVFITGLLPGVGGNINLGFFYLSPLRLALLLLPVTYVGEHLLHIRNGKYVLKCENRRFILFMVVWFVYSMATVFWCRDLSSWSHGEYFIGLGIWSMLFFDMAGLKKEDFLDILKAIQLAVIAHNILGWYELLTHNYLFAPAERLVSMRASRQYYPITTMLNQNDLILVLIWGACISAYFVLTSKKQKYKIINLMLFFSNIALGIATDSRAGILGMIIAILILGGFILSKNQKICFVGGMIALVSLSAILLPQIYMELWNKFQGIELLNFENPNVNSDAVRLNLIRNGLVFLKETFGFGVGTSNAEYWMANETVYNVRGFTNVHNWWAEILTNFGIIIFVLYIIFYIFLFYSIWKRYRQEKDKNVKVFCMILLCFMGAFLAASVSSSSNWGKEWLWILWAFIIAFQGSSDISIERESRNEKIERDKKVDLSSQLYFTNVQ